MRGHPKIGVRNHWLDVMPDYAYLDTNASRYFGYAFENTTLADDLRDKILISPLSAFEAQTLSRGMGLCFGFRSPRFPLIERNRGSCNTENLANSHLSVVAQGQYAVFHINKDAYCYA